MKESLRGIKLFLDQYKIVIYPVLVGLASLFLIIFLILPQISGFFSGQSNLEVAKNRLEILTAKAEGLEAIDNDQLQKQVALAVTALPSGKDLARVIGVMQGVAKASGLALLSVQIGQTTSSAASGGFSVKVEVSGSEFALSNFLRNVESSSRVMKVGAMDLAFSKVQNNIDAAVTVEVFYSPTPQALGAVTDSLPQITPEDEKIIISLSRAPVSTYSASPANILIGKSNPFE